jgi:hypothetical protein
MQFFLQLADDADNGLEDRPGLHRREPGVHQEASRGPRHQQRHRQEASLRAAVRVMCPTTKRVTLAPLTLWNTTRSMSHFVALQIIDPQHAINTPQTHHLPEFFQN